MSNPLESFRHYTKEEWLSHISGTMRSGRAEDLEWMITDELKGLVFAHADDVPVSCGPMPGSGYGNGWEMGFCPRDPFRPDQWIDPAHHFIRIPNAGLTDKELFYQGSGLEMKKLILHFGRLKELSELEQSGFSMPGMDRSILIELEGVMDADPAKVRSLLKNIPGFSGLILPLHGIGSGDSPVEVLSSHLMKTYHWIRELENEKEILEWWFGHIFLSYPVSARSLFELSLIRAIRILYYNLQEVHGLPLHDIPVIARVDTFALADDPNDQLILSSVAILSAVLAGANIVLIQSGNAMNSQGQSMDRLLRNIQLIFKHESKLNLVSDPLAGSYAIEQLTNNLATLAWQAFTEKLDA